MINAIPKIIGFQYWFLAFSFEHGNISTFSESFGDIMDNDDEIFKFYTKKNDSELAPQFAVFAD